MNFYLLQNQNILKAAKLCFKYDKISFNLHRYSTYYIIQLIISFLVSCHIRNYLKLF